MGHPMIQGFSVLGHEWKALLEGHAGLKLAEFLTGRSSHFLLTTGVPEHKHTPSINAAVPDGRREIILPWSCGKVNTVLLTENLNKHGIYPGKNPVTKRIIQEQWKESHWKCCGTSLVCAWFPGRAERLQSSGKSCKNNRAIIKCRALFLVHMGPQ